MNKKKLILIIVGSVLLFGAIGITIYQLIKKKKEEADGENPFVAKQTSLSIPTPNSFSQSQDPAPQQTSNLIEPTFDEEGQLSNSLSRLKNRMLYPKRKTDGGFGYSNVRSSAEVNNDEGFWDYGNLLTTISAGTPIGRVISEEINMYNGFPYRWLKVKLVNPVGGWFTPYKEAFVRADTVIFKSFAP